MSWQVSSLAILTLAIAGGFVWYERSRPSARILAAVAALAALGVAGRIALAPIPNVVATTDVALLAGYAIGGGPGFAVGALSGLVSNFWLGQGPWTPWQMAGWGAVGVAGAVLARLSGRDLSRLQLALAGAAAGLAYGALLDLSAMVTFGGEQSLDRYLALSVRGLPFNIAHAVGNFVIMFAAGPALVRMLARYRARFEHRWSDAPLGRAAVSLAVLACLTGPLLAPPGASAASGISGARDWLTAAQNDDAGYGIAPDADSSVAMTGWAMLGLEAAGVNPRDLLKGEASPVTYLRDHASEITSTGDLERTILGLEGAGVGSRSFQGRDLVAELRDRQARDGSFEHQINLTAFAILAQRAAGVERTNVSAPAQYLRSVQNRNGGWGSTDGAASEPDSTGAAIQAMAAGPGGAGQAAAGADWLEQSQRGSGGWSLTAGISPNTQSTAWAVQGILAAGRSPGTIRNNGSSGSDYIAGRQASDGHYSYSSQSDQTPVWVTAQGLTATARGPFPIAAVPREKPEQPSDSGTTGDSGGSTSDSGYYGGSLGDSGAGSYGAGGYGAGDYGGFGNYGNYGAGAGRKGTSSPSGSGPGVPESEPGSAPSGPTDATGRARIAANSGALDQFSQSAVTSGTLPAQDSALPPTLAFVGLLGLLAAALGAGFLWFRKRLP